MLFHTSDTPTFLLHNIILYRTDGLFSVQLSRYSISYFRNGSKHNCFFPFKQNFKNTIVKMIPRRAPRIRDTKNTTSPTVRVSHDPPPSSSLLN